MDWEYWLGRKYDIMQQGASADTTRANAGMLSAKAGANLDTVRAGLLPAESAANIGLTNAQAANTNETTRFIAPRAKADIGLIGSQTNLTGQQAYGAYQDNKLMPSSGFKIGGLLGNDFSDRLKSFMRIGMGPFGQ